VVHGHGVIAGENIPKATLVSSFTGRVYKSAVSAMEDRIVKRFPGIYVFKTNKGGGRWIVPDRSCKEAKYFNTSMDEVSIKLLVK
jgi:hypothetical protein